MQARIDSFNAHDCAWAKAEWALNRAPHAPLRMLSLNSHGPLKSYFCPICSARNHVIIEYDIKHSTHTCYGGLQFRYDGFDFR